MLRYLLCGCVILLFTACSEMKVIGNAALREFKADGINVERVAYQSHKN